jgi:hypothetical protein
MDVQVGRWQHEAGSASFGINSTALGELWSGKLGPLDAKHFHDEEPAAGISLGWMHIVVQPVMRGYAGEFMRTVEASHS